MLLLDVFSPFVWAMGHKFSSLSRISTLELRQERRGLSGFFLRRAFGILEILFSLEAMEQVNLLPREVLKDGADR